MFGVDAGGGAAGEPFDGAVDFGIIETFMNKASVAGDACFGGSAVNVAMSLAHGIREQIHRWLSDAFCRGADGAMVGTDKVSFTSK